MRRIDLKVVKVAAVLAQRKSVERDVERPTAGTTQADKALQMEGTI
jgi:hypothetical protein